MFIGFIGFGVYRCFSGFRVPGSLGFRVQGI